MKTKTVIFLKPFTIINPTLDEQNSFMMREILNEVECAEMGIIYNYDDLYSKDIADFITKKVKEHRPEWIVAEGECATAVLKNKQQSKVLINPKVTFADLNNIPEHTRQCTFGFFDSQHEQDYEYFLSVYPHAAWFPQSDNLTLYTIKEAIQSIIEVKER